MSLLDKVGVYYMYNTRKTLTIEVLLNNGLIVLYKIAYFIIPYLGLMLIGSHLMKKGKTDYTKLAILHVAINAILVFVFGLYFHIDVKALLNPLLGTILASLTIYLIASFWLSKWWRRPMPTSTGGESLP